MIKRQIVQKQIKPVILLHPKGGVAIGNEEAFKKAAQSYSGTLDNCTSTTSKPEIQGHRIPNAIFG